MTAGDNVDETPRPETDGEPDDEDLSVDETDDLERVATAYNTLAAVPSLTPFRDLAKKWSAFDLGAVTGAAEGFSRMNLGPTAGFLKAAESARIVSESMQRFTPLPEIDFETLVANSPATHLRQTNELLREVVAAGATAEINAQAERDKADAERQKVGDDRKSQRTSRRLQMGLAVIGTAAAVVAAWASVVLLNR